MTKKMPSGTNFFKALIKEEPEESNSVLNTEIVPEQKGDKAYSESISDESDKLKDVIKIMEQAVLEENNDVKDSEESSLPVTIIQTDDNDSLEIKAKEQEKKNKPVVSIEDKTVTSNTPVKSVSEEKTPLTKRSIYFRPEQYLQIRIRAAQEDCDGSLIVRQAIDAYFNNDTK